MIKFVCKILLYMSLFVGGLFVIVDTIDERKVKETVLGCIGQQLILSDSLIFLNDCKQVSINGFKYKILYYVPPKECLGCKLNFLRWNEFMNKLLQYDVTLIFLVHEGNKNEITRYANQLEFKYPIVFSGNNEIYCKIDSILEKSNGINVFLLDESDFIKAIGNPLLNRKVKELYEEIISN